MDSFRTGMNRGLGIEGQTNLKGPSFINLMFDISCNLACRTCGPQLSTYWQHHLRENKEWQGPISSPKRANDVIAALDQLDLTELKQVVLTGGETLLGNSYWEVVQWLVDHVPNAKDQLTICFQTNGTQSIPQKYFETIARTKLVKLHISIDAVDERFEYLRWPARWQALEQNIFSIRESCPSNVMFVVEETISIFNLFYSRETKSWCQNNFSSNREGDIVNHSRHLAHGIYSLDNCTDEYAQAIAGSNASDLIPQHRKENPVKIISMLDQIKKIDGFRKQSFANTFPEVFEFYKRYW